MGGFRPKSDPNRVILERCLNGWVPPVALGTHPFQNISKTTRSGFVRSGFASMTWDDGIQVEILIFDFLIKTAKVLCAKIVFLFFKRNWDRGV